MNEFEEYLRHYQPVPAHRRVIDPVVGRTPPAHRWSMRTLAGLAAVAFLASMYGVLIFPGAEPPAARAARAVFEQLDRTAQRASSLKVRFTCEGMATVDGESAPFAASGMLLVRSDNRANLSYSVRRGSESKDIRFVSNGTMMSTGLLFEEETPKHLYSDLVGTWIRLGFISSHGLRNPERDRSSKGLYQLSDFAAGPDEDGAKTLTYRVSTPDKPAPPLSMKLWYDPATRLILKRQVTNPVRQFTEVYTECLVDQAIPDEAFRASKH
jgi:hypothetical protein